MAVGQCSFPIMHPVAGITLGTANAGIKQTVRDDILVIQMVEQATCAAVFTQNAFCAAPVHVAKANLARSPRWLLINSGNANAGTGEQGMKDALMTCADLAEVVDGTAVQVLPFSTGVIGQPLPVNKIKASLREAVFNLDTNNWDKAAHAIMTTDTFPKGVSTVIEIDGQTITINGISKGAGMIQPNMATMLAFIMTDAAIEREVLDRLFRESVAVTFNAITVDGCMSTNDTAVILANGLAGNPLIKRGSRYAEAFGELLSRLLSSLARAMVRDGEGATKMIEITVTEARSPRDAQRIAYAIANSNLVKTAFFGGDPNWGRIISAAGSVGVDLPVEKVRLFLEEIPVFAEEKGVAGKELELAGIMKQPEIRLRIALGMGRRSWTVFTSDLTFDYVKINAHYHT